ncbi:hypothetical protein ACIRQP_38850 [Streptomyces sp. NPDC102274]|uniref:MmyB family transcriptional regulator n=1 Tax=Streptomyces sp. NPDC102274 TaxID=3366151 RepID=UPI0038219937
MDRCREIAEFLRSRRAGVTPGQAGMTGDTRGRRVPGLRRARRYSRDRQLADLVGELTLHSPEFTTRWNDHRVLILQQRFSICAGQGACLEDSGLAVRQVDRGS